MATHERTRNGFTLIEIITVMCIISVIAGIGSYAAIRALNSARQRGVIIEMENLSKGIELYKTENKLYPPCMGALPNSQVLGTLQQMGVKGREAAFDAHIRARWPRCTTMSYAMLQQALITGTSPYQYNYMGPTGSQAMLNLETMDQAEAMVFWLAGFPSPVDKTGVPYSSSPLIGFNNDPQYPFRLPTKVTTSTSLVENRSAWTAYFPFDAFRLSDVDKDGWLEYRPNLPKGDPEALAPFVYYDAATYAMTRSRTGNITFSSYPPLSKQAPFSGMLSSLEAQWGIAVPYAADVNDSGMIMWHRPQSYQIIAPGFDGMYGTPGEQAMYVPVYPGGYEWVAKNGPGFSEKEGLDRESEDNLTSFAESKLSDGFVGR